VQRLIYFNLWTIVEEYPDWRLLALSELEYMIVCEASDSNIPFYTKEDVAQELRLTLWNNLNKFDPSLASIKTWAKRVIKNKLIDLDRRETCTKKRKDHLHIPFSYMVADGKKIQN